MSPRFLLPVHDEGGSDLLSALYSGVVTTSRTPSSSIVSEPENTNLVIVAGSLTWYQMPLPATVGLAAKGIRELNDLRLFDELEKLAVVSNSPTAKTVHFGPARPGASRIANSCRSIRTNILTSGGQSSRL